MNFLKTSFFFLCVFVPATEFALSALEANVEVQLSSTNIWPRELVYVSFVISNGADHAISRQAAALGSWRIRKQGEQTWRNYSWYGVQCDPPPEATLTLPPGKTFFHYAVVSLDIRKKPFFGEAGNYEVQAVTCFGKSETRVVNVRDLPAGDAFSLIPETVAFLFEERMFAILWEDEWIFRKRSLDPPSMPVFKQLSNYDEYADWVLLIQLWTEKYGAKHNNRADDGVISLCRKLIEKYDDRPVPENRNPIPLFWAYMQLARQYGSSGQLRQSSETLTAARMKFSNNQTLLFVLDWEGQSIPQLNPPSRILDPWTNSQKACP